MQPERPSIWWHDSIENASGKPGALHLPPFRVMNGTSCSFHWLRSGLTAHCQAIAMSSVSM
jgi:hypothetical protein